MCSDQEEKVTVRINPNIQYLERKSYLLFGEKEALYLKALSDV